jgi:hypothetical protein
LWFLLWRIGRIWRWRSFQWTICCQYTYSVCDIIWSFRWKLSLMARVMHLFSAPPNICYHLHVR